MARIRTVLLCLLGALLADAAEPTVNRKMDLQREARIFASHATPGDEFRIENAIDGDPETKWVGEAHPLSFQPANIVIEFSKPEIIDGIMMHSIIFRDRLALKDVELYACTDDGWAGATPVVKFQATNVLTQIQFPAVNTSALRIRIRDTWREDHSYPRIHEIAVQRAPPGTTGRSLKPGPIADEKGSERFVLRRASGEKYIAPGTAFDPAKGYAHYVREFIDTMIRDGTDRYAKLAIERLFFNGLFRGATAIDHYESDLMPGNLAYNLLWLETAKNTSSASVNPNYFNR